MAMTLLLVLLSALAGASSGGGPRYMYFTWYDVGSGPLMHYTTATTNLRLSSTPEQASTVRAASCPPGAGSACPSCL